MEKSVFTAEYAAMLALLRKFRRGAGVTQVELAARLGQTQSFVSKVERGESRLDVIQLRTICYALGITLLEFITALEAKLPSRARAPRRSR